MCGFSVHEGPRMERAWLSETKELRLNYLLSFPNSFVLVRGEQLAPIPKLNFTTMSGKLSLMMRLWIASTRSYGSGSVDTLRQPRALANEQECQVSESTTEPA